MIIHVQTGTRRKARLAAAVTMLLAVICTAVTASAARASSLAQFNRETYLYSTTLSPAQEANRYQTIVLQATDAAKVPALKAGNPNLKIFMYQDPKLSRQSDSLGLTVCSVYSQIVTAHPNWFVRDAAGNPISPGGAQYSGNYIMDVGNPAYQQYCLAHATALAKKDGFDGIYFDDLSAVLAWNFPAGHTTPQYTTDAAWQAATYSMIAYAGAQSHANGLLAVGNIGGAWTTPGLWAKWTAPLDGSEEEGWTDPADHYYWAAQLANSAWSQANGKYLILHAHGATETANTFGLASMMLVAAGNASYSTANSNYTSAESWYPEYNTAQSLGAPTGTYTKLASGVYERWFTGGVVLVNPSGSTQTMHLAGGTYSGSRLASASGVTLGAWSGLILLADSGNPPPPPSGTGTSAPANSGAPVVSGSAVQGQTLTAGSGAWSGNPAPTYTYQWMRCVNTGQTSCVPIAGATAPTYQVQAADIGDHLDVTVTATNGVGTSQSISAETAAVKGLATPAFSLSASPSSQHIRHGRSARYTVTVTPTNGFTGSVALSVAGLPRGATAYFGPASAGGSSTLSVYTTSASIGRATITVSGTGGGQAGATTLSLRVE